MGVYANTSSINTLSQPRAPPPPEEPPPLLLATVLDGELLATISTGKLMEEFDNIDELTALNKLLNDDELTVTYDYNELEVITNKFIS